MTPYTAMTILTTVILLSVFYIAIAMTIKVTMQNSSGYRSVNLLAVQLVVLILYLIACAVFYLLFVYSGYDSLILYAGLCIGVLAILVLFIRFSIRNRQSMRNGFVVLFLAYFALVLYLTVFMRIGQTDTTVLTTPFDDLYQAIVTRDIAQINHLMLNILLFLPFGFLIPAMNPSHFHVWSFALLGGLCASTVIEMTQMIFQLGESDIDDIIANTVGAVLGYCLISFVWHVQENWRIR